MKIVILSNKLLFRKCQFVWSSTARAWVYVRHESACNWIFSSIFYWAGFPGDTSFPDDSRASPMIPERPSGLGAELKEPGDTPTLEAVLAVLFGGWFFVFAAISWWGICKLYIYMYYVWRVLCRQAACVCGTNACDLSRGVAEKIHPSVCTVCYFVTLTILD